MEKPMVTSRRTAKDIMSSPVYTVRLADPLVKLIDVICRHGASGRPVVQGMGRLIGLISERYILRTMYPGNVRWERRPRMHEWTAPRLQLMFLREDQYAA